MNTNGRYIFNFLKEHFQILILSKKEILALMKQNNFLTGITLPGVVGVTGVCGLISLFE